MSNPHPNATLAGSVGGAGVGLVWLLGNVFHVNVSAEAGAAIASGAGTVVLFIGRHGIAGAWNLIKHGTGTKP